MAIQRHKGGWSERSAYGSYPDEICIKADIGIFVTGSARKADEPPALLLRPRVARIGHWALRLSGIVTNELGRTNASTLLMVIIHHIGGEIAVLAQDI